MQNEKDMRVKCLKYIVIWVVAILFISSCKTTEYIVEKEIEYIEVRDTVRIESELKEKETHKTDTEITRETKSDLFLPCPEEGEKGSEGVSSSGKNYSKHHYDEDRGGYVVELYCAEQINVKDSINKSLEIQLKEYKNRELEHKNELFESSEKNKKSFWQHLLNGVYSYLFYILLALWLFGITPKFIFKKLF